MAAPAIETTIDIANDLKASESSPEVTSGTISLQARSRVLETQELLDIIFQHIHPGFGGQVNVATLFPTDASEEPFSQHLLWGSLVCKAFFLPAIRTLWHDASLLELLRVIPVLKMQGGVYNFTELVQEEHLRRLQLYGRCIRHLRLSKFNEPISSHVFTMLSRSCHPNLTPGLQSLSIPTLAEVCVENLNGLFLLLSSKLDAIRIDGINSTTEILVASWLRETSSEAPLLRTLCLAGLTQTTLDIIPSFKALTTIRISIQSNSASLDVLKSCSQINTLRTLYLLFDRSYVYTNSSVVLNFHKLHYLYIMAPVTAMVNLIGTVYAPNANHFGLRFLLRTQPVNLDDMQVSACLERCVQNTGAKLASIDVHGAIHVSWKALLPISKIPRPTKIRVNIDGLVMTDGDISKFFGSRDWSKLQHLEVMGFLTRTDVDTLSPAALGIIAMHCPSLVTLKLSFTVSTGTTALENLKTQPHSDASGLKHLEKVSIVVCKSPNGEFDPGPNAVKGAAIISRYIDQCLSNVQLIELQHPNNEGGQWLEGVYEMLTNYRTLRGLK